MAIELKKERIISLLNKDFAAIKKTLINYAQAYSSGSFSDFNEASPGMALLEFNAAVGDFLCFYIDQKYNETRDSTAQELANVQAMAKMRGYKPAGKRPARGIVDFAIEVPSIANTFGEVVPDDRYIPSLLKGSQSVANNGVFFETLDDIHFTASIGRSVTGSQFDQATGLPTHFALMKSIEAIAGKTTTETFTIDSFVQFRKLELAESDVIEVIDIFDSQGNEWFEVEHLAQDWVFSEETNTNDTQGTVPYVLKMISVPRRFVVDRDITTGKSSLVFGSGDGTSFDDEYVPNVAELAIPLAGRRTYSSFAVDPQNFLKTRSLGLSPHDTTLTVRYRIGGGQETNVPARSIKQVSFADLSFGTSGLDASIKGLVEGSIGCNNKVSMQGGGPAETLREVKLNASAYHAAQDRVVTREDVVARVLSMPTRFGKIDKAYVKTTPGSRFSYDVHVLSRDVDGVLTVAPTALKSNVATFLRKYRMLTDDVNILDAKIIDLRIDFRIVVSSRNNRSSVLAVCLAKLADYFDSTRSQIGAPIVLSDVVSFIHATPGVVSVNDFNISNVFGVTDNLTYSDTRFDVESARRDGIVICPQDSIFNVKFPRKDIKGSAR